MFLGDISVVRMTTSWEKDKTSWYDEFNQLSPDKLRKNGTFKQQMAFFTPDWSNLVPNLTKGAF